MFLLKRHLGTYLSVIILSIIASSLLIWQFPSVWLILPLIIFNLCLMIGLMPFLILKDAKNKLSLITAYKEYKSNKISKEKFYSICLEQFVDVVDNPIVSTAHAVTSNVKIDKNKLLTGLLNRVK